MPSSALASAGGRPPARRRRGGARLAVLATGMLLIPAASGAVEAAPAVAWIQAADWAQPSANADRLTAERMIDGRRATSFCVGGGTEGADAVRIEIGLTVPARITHVRVMGSPGGAPVGAASPSRLRLQAGRHAVRIPYRDEALTWRLPVPLEGDRVDLRIEPGENVGASLVCLPDLVFIAAGRVVSPLAAAPEPPARRLQGSWASGPPSSPERFVMFQPDGRFYWIYAPNDPARLGRTLNGRFEAGPEVVILRTPAGEHQLRFIREDEGPQARLRLFGATGPLEPVNGAYRSQ